MNNFDFPPGSVTSRVGPVHGGGRYVVPTRQSNPGEPVAACQCDNHSCCGEPYLREAVFFAALVLAALVLAAAFFPASFVAPKCWTAA
jgi:hypothetical protein